MVLLDADHLSLLERGGPGSFGLQLRLEAPPAGELATTTITYEEQMRGSMARLAQASSTPRLRSAYAHLLTHIDTFRAIPVVPFDEAAAMEYERLLGPRVRIGAVDLRIASIAVTHRALLLTRNRADFARVPDLRDEGWTI